MRLSHFEHFAPRCPACVWRARGADPSRAPVFDCAPMPALALERIESREGAGSDGGGVIVHGALRCLDCGERFPIIDGVPVIVADVNEQLRRHSGAILRRRDLPSGIEDLVSEAIGPDDASARTMLYTSAYAWDHYGVGGVGGASGSGDDGREEHGDAVRVLRRLTEMAGNCLGGARGVQRVLDVGCATGGASFELGAMVGELACESGSASGPGSESELGGGLVLGIDMHLAMLRVAQASLRTGVAEYALRHEGVVYSRVRAAVEARRMRQAHRVDFWCCDALCMPFASASIDACASLHTLEAVANPAGLLSELARVTRGGEEGQGGRVLLATPFDWTQSVTAMEHWLGGRAAHAPHGGDGASVLEWLLREGAPSGSGIDRLRVMERDDMNWRVRLYARATTHYRTHLLACEVRDPQS